LGLTWFNPPLLSCLLQHFGWFDCHISKQLLVIPHGDPL
jgi:hypothetical protein